MTVVLDASLLIAAMERRETPSRRALLELMAGVAAGTQPRPALSALTVAELLRGVAGDEDLADVYRPVLATCTVHDVTERLARHAAALAAAADARGLPTRDRPGLVDAIVGALALDLDAELVATDPDFHALPGLRLTVLPEADS